MDKELPFWIIFRDVWEGSSSLAKAALKKVAFERQLAQLPASRFCFGDTPSLADCCLAPQIYNAQRFNTPLDGLPRTMAAFEAGMALPAFQAAHPSACPDAEA